MRGRPFYRPRVLPLPSGSKLSKPAQVLRWVLAWLALLPWGWAYLLYGWWTP